MIILKSKPKQGRITELIKRFMEDKSMATLISDNLTLYDICNIEEYLSSNGTKFVNRKKKKIYTDETDLYEAIEDEALGNIYIANSILKDDFKDVKEYCKAHEDRNDITITFTQQLPADSILEGVYVVEI